MRLVEDAVRIVIAVWILIPYPSSLTYWVWVDAANDVTRAATSSRVLPILTVGALAGDKKYSLVEATYHRYLWWLLWRLLSLALILILAVGLLLRLVLTLILILWMSLSLILWLLLLLLLLSQSRLHLLTLVLILGWSHFLLLCLSIFSFLRLLGFICFSRSLCWTSKHILMLRNVVWTSSLFEEYLTCAVGYIALLWIWCAWQLLLLVLWNLRCHLAALI